ncbi:MAG: DNA-methyltransferase [Phycisphaerales bacterium]
MTLIVNRIVTGDCLEVLARLPDACVDLIVFSPPYDDLRAYEGGWSVDSRRLGEELLRVTKDGGIAAVVLGDATKKFAKSLTTFRWAVDWVDRVGWRLFECCIYARHGRPGPWWRTRFRVDHEYIMLFLKGERPRRFDKQALRVPTKLSGRVFRTPGKPAGGRRGRSHRPTLVGPLKCRGTVWHYAASTSEGNRLKLRHPATFPDKLAEDLIRCFSVPGDLVLDPMCGSGTTPVMAARHRRRYLGVDVSRTYTAICRKRLRHELSRGLPTCPGRKRGSTV